MIRIDVYLEGLFKDKPFRVEEDHFLFDEPKTYRCHHYTYDDDMIYMYDKNGTSLGCIFFDMLYDHAKEGD